MTCVPETKSYKSECKGWYYPPQKVIKSVATSNIAFPFWSAGFFLNHFMANKDCLIELTVGGY